MISLTIGVCAGLAVGIPLGMWWAASFAWRTLRNTWKRWMS